LVNLLSNAIKFTHQGEVELSITFLETSSRNEGEFIFKVRDTGIGINPENQKKLFKAFSQADPSTTRKFGGTGLGLVISNKLAQKMDSAIQLKSKEGKGSEFFFALKKTYQRGPALPVQILKDKIKRVLIIDDNHNNCQILQLTCKSWGIKADVVYNGYDAIQKIKNQPAYDILIIDYDMPQLDGLATVKLIHQKIQQQKNRPIILLYSSVDNHSNYDILKKLGVRLKLVKPVKNFELF
jgi:CheY-like chemotaxis protein